VPQYVESRLFLALSYQHVLFPVTRSKDTTFTVQSLHIITLCKSDVFLFLLDRLAYAGRYLAGKVLDLFVRRNLRPEDEGVKACCKRQRGQYLDPVGARPLEGSAPTRLTTASTVGDAAHKVCDT
jgi:hypothetical protein